MITVRIGVVGYGRVRGCDAVRVTCHVSEVRITVKVRVTVTITITVSNCKW